MPAADTILANQRLCAVRLVGCMHDACHSRYDSMLGPLCGGTKSEVLIIKIEQML